ncbi:MAG: DegQ family serine endoprotease [Candidatus Binatia bacterium]
MNKGWIVLVTVVSVLTTVSPGMAGVAESKLETPARHWTPVTVPQTPPLEKSNVTQSADTGAMRLMRVSQMPSIAEVAEKAMTAVVNISTTQKAPQRPRSPFPMPGPSPFGGDDPLEEFFRRFFGDRPPLGPRRSLGSGFIISTDGYIITNNHVIANANEITVRLSAPQHDEYKATVIGSDEQTDLALIKIDANRSLPTLPLGSSESLRVGDWVVAIGNPFGLEQTVTLGIVSAKGRVIGAGPYDDFIQTDASINPGNSGGPLLNLQGEAVGVNSAIFSRGGGNIGIGFAIPIDLTKMIISQLRESGAVTRAWLGVTIQGVTPELAQSFGLERPRGALVADVSLDSPAERGGIERGDIIVKFNDATIENAHELPTIVARSQVGSKATVTVLREGQEKNIPVTLGKLQEEQARASSEEEGGKRWGMTVANLTPEIARRFQLEEQRKGVVVVNVEPASPAAEAGLQAGDIIEEVNRQAVNSVDEFVKKLSQIEKQRDTVLLLVRRNNVVSFFALRKPD